MNVFDHSIVICAIATVFAIGCSTNNKDTMNQSPGNEFSESEMEKAFEAFTEAFINRKIYTELNDEVIRAIPDEHLVQAVVDFIGVRIARDWEHDVKKVPSLGAGFSAIYFLSVLETEVNNGGFNQMFYNNGREAVVHAKHGADLLSLKALSSAIEKALIVEQAQRGKMAGVREAGTLEAFMRSYEDADFDDLDDAFIAQAKEIEKAMITFIRRNSSMFCGKADG